MVNNKMKEQREEAKREYPRASDGCLVVYVYLHIDPRTIGIKEAERLYEEIEHKGRTFFTNGW